MKKNIWRWKESHLKKSCSEGEKFGFYLRTCGSRGAQRCDSSRDDIQGQCVLPLGGPAPHGGVYRRLPCRFRVWKYSVREDSLDAE